MRNHGSINAFLKPLLLVAWLASLAPSYVERLTQLGPSLSAAVYLALFAVLSSALLLSAGIRNHLVRIVIAIVLFCAAVFFGTYQAATNDFMTYDAFISLLGARGFVGEAIGQHSGSIITETLRSLLLLTAIALPPGRVHFRIPDLARAGALVAGILMLAAIMFVRGGDGGRGLPTPYVPLAYSLLAGYEAANSTIATRQEVALPISSQPKGGDIVLLIDESVAANYLDIDNPNGVATGLLAAHRGGASIHNFGYASSIGNCSMSSNLTLRYGGTHGDYLRIISTMPSIWAYAKKAGLRTVYIDAQRTGGNLQNGMDDSERAQIDRIIQFDTTPPVGRDMAVADALVALINDDHRDFIYANKIGAHFPVNDKFPDAYLRYSPVLPRGTLPQVSDTGSRLGFGGSQADWLRYRNSYRNTLLWNVGHFFDRLFTQADLRNTTMIYTSDHGQDLHERGNPGKNTHCSPEPVMEEGLVPLVVIAGDAVDSGFDWTAQAKAGHGRSSHFQIFPTTLMLMGYDHDAVRRTYGAGLDETGKNPFAFNYLFNARLGKKPLWKNIDLEHIVVPDKVEHAPSR